MLIEWLQNLLLKKYELKNGDQAYTNSHLSTFNIMIHHQEAKIITLQRYERVSFQTPCIIMT